MPERLGDVSFEVDAAHVAEVQIQRPPNNFFDIVLIHSLATVYERLDEDDDCRAILLTSAGKHFCAGADFSSSSLAEAKQGSGDNLYQATLRLFATAKPVVACVQGSAVGGGLGLACSADLRVASPESRFHANFSRLGLHHGFGLTVTLPNIVGQSAALDLLYTGRRVPGEEAYRLGLCDRLAATDELRTVGHALAASVAGAGPLAVQAIRRTMRQGLYERVQAATGHESAEQDRLRLTADWAEGVRASGERREPIFRGF